MSLDQKRARVFGVLFLITFITSIPALVLYQPVLDDPVGYIASAGHDNRILFAALLELLLIVANIGTAVVVYPILRRQSEELSLGYVTARLFDSPRRRACGSQGGGARRGTRLRDAWTVRGGDPVASYSSQVA